MGYLIHGHIQWKSPESAFIFIIQDSFLTQHVLEPSRRNNVLSTFLFFTK